MKNFFKDYLFPIGLLSGAIIGAGIFSLPYIFKEAGLGTGFFYLALVAFIYVVMHLMYADIILRTPGKHRFVGYTRLFLGDIASWISIWMTIIEMVFVLTIYLILSKDFVSLIFPFGSGFQQLIIFWVLGSAAIFLPLKRIAFTEFLITGGIVGIIILIFIIGIKGIENIGTINFNFSFPKIILPLAPVFFALSGRVAIPCLVDYFKGDHNKNHLIKKSIIWGTILPAVVYALFVLGIIGLSPIVTETSVGGLVGHVSSIILFLIGVLGIFSLWSSYLVVGLDVNNALRYDLKTNFFWRFIIVIIGPLLIYFSGFKDYITLIGFVGGIFLAFEGLFVVGIWLKARKKLEKPSIFFKRKNLVIIGIMILIFASALLYEISSFASK